jgi:hypothetical protein
MKEMRVKASFMGLLHPLLRSPRMGRTTVGMFGRRLPAIVLGGAPHDAFLAFGFLLHGHLWRCRDFPCCRLRDRACTERRREQEAQKSDDSSHHEPHDSIHVIYLSEFFRIGTSLGELRRQTSRGDEGLN